MMKRCSVKPYEGEEPFVFISYCHKDRAHIFPIIENMARDGYRVWYDEGIDPGSEWPEIIARHLNSCTVCIAFLSANSLDSHNCRREVNFALLNNKQFISVILEAVTMPLGMEMQISSNQAIFKYKYASETEFYTVLYKAECLKSCKGFPDYSVVVSRPEDYIEDMESDMFSGKIQTRQPFSDKWFADKNNLTGRPSAVPKQEQEKVVLPVKEDPAQEPEKAILPVKEEPAQKKEPDAVQPTDISSDPPQQERQKPAEIKKAPSAPSVTFYLVRVKNNERVRILPGKIVMGRSETRADYQIVGNSTIGRVHASVELRGGVCYIIDLHSKNKTKINQIPLEPEREYALKDGDKVQLSNEVFIFKAMQE